MKIYVLPVDKEFRPDRQNFMSPPHNMQYGVEQDFEGWLSRHPEYVSYDADKADYHLFQPYWNRYFVNSWGQEGIEELQNEILRLVSRNKPTFTICEYDVANMQSFDLCNMTVFTASRRGVEQTGIDIPLLCSAHKIPGNSTQKKWLASFVGNLVTDGIRSEMKAALTGKDFHIEQGGKGTEYFVNLMLASYVGLAPRGHGGQSFRFYEAMQLGVVPYLIGIPDTRPFAKWIDWSRCSIYAPTVKDIRIPTGLEAMGKAAWRTWRDDLQYGQWCKYVLKELACLT